MANLRTCTRCGAPIPEAAPPGECPVCLLLLASNASDSGGAVASPTPTELQPHFPELEILELLGAGGMGAVYKAKQTDLNRFVALKLLDPRRAEDPVFAERFLREAQALGRLSHPRIVAVYDFGRAGGWVHIVMEYVDGANLRDCLRGGKLSSPEALRLIPQLCDAVQYAHDQGVVHRDIKPENVLIDRAGNVKVADFGLAKIAGDNAVTLTGHGERMGTARYMAPEQWAHSAAVDHRADIYSLGVLFYEMLTGDVPTPQYTPPSVKAESDPRLDRVVARSLRDNPDERYQRAAEIKEDVRRIVDRPAWPWLGAAVVTVLVIASLFVAWLPFRSVDRTPEAALFSDDWEWSPPENLGPGVNTDGPEQTPFLSADMLTLLFAAKRPDARGEHDLYECRRASADVPFANPLNMGTTVNSDSIDESPCLSADGLTMYFVSNRPPGDNTKIWVARRRTVNHLWDEPEMLGPQINSDSAQYRPWLSRDGLTLTFTTLRTGRNAVWISRRSSVDEPFRHAEPFGRRPVRYGIGNVASALDGRVLFVGRMDAQHPGDLLAMGRVTDPDEPFRDLISFGPTINSLHVDSSPSPTPDGRFVVFESNRPGGHGGYDLWMTRRAPKK